MAWDGIFGFEGLDRAGGFGEDFLGDEDFSVFWGEWGVRNIVGVSANEEVDVLEGGDELGF